MTAFRLRTFPQGDLWAGDIYYGLDTAPQQLQAFYEFSAVSAAEYDPYASMIQSFGFSGTQGGAFVNALSYARPTVNTSAFEPFLEIQPQLASTMAITDLISLSQAEEAESPDGFRYVFSSFSLMPIFYTENSHPISQLSHFFFKSKKTKSNQKKNSQLTFATSFLNSLPTLQNTYSVWNASVADVAAIPGITWSLSIEPISASQTAVSTSLGGNSLGLSVPSPSDTIVIALLSATWNDAGDDARILTASNALLDGIESGAKARGTFNPYQDLNHAGAYQRPIDGYGAAAKARLQAVSRKYDPLALFQTVVPGGFKLFT